MKREGGIGSERESARARERERERGRERERERERERDVFGDNLDYFCFKRGPANDGVVLHFLDSYGHLAYPLCHLRMRAASRWCIRMCPYVNV